MELLSFIRPISNGSSGMSNSCKIHTEHGFACIYRILWDSHSSYFTKSVAQTSLSSYNAPLIHAHSRHCSVFIAIWLDVILHFTFCHPY